MTPILLVFVSHEKIWEFLLILLDSWLGKISDFETENAPKNRCSFGAFLSSNFQFLRLLTVYRLFFVEILKRILGHGNINIRGMLILSFSPLKKQVFMRIFRQKFLLKWLHSENSFFYHFSLEKTDEKWYNIKNMISVKASKNISQRAITLRNIRSRYLLTQGTHWDDYNVSSKKLTE